MYSNIEFLITLFVILSLPSPSNLFSSIYSSIFVTSVLDYTMTSPQAFIFRAGEKKSTAKVVGITTVKGGRGGGVYYFAVFCHALNFQIFKQKT